MMLAFGVLEQRLNSFQDRLRFDEMFQHVAHKNHVKCLPTKSRSPFR